MQQRQEEELSSPLDHADGRERLILAHVPLLRHIVGRMIAPSGFDRDDLYGIGMLGLIGAADTWEAERGLKFSTYAYTRIRGAILDELRRSDRLSRGAREQLREVERAIARLEQEHGTVPPIEDVAQALGSTVGEVEEVLVAGRVGIEASLDEEHEGTGTLAALLGDPKSEDPVGSAEWNEAKARLVDVIGMLPEQEKSVITLYYGEGLLLREIGQVLGVTESRVSQIHSRAIYELNRLLGSPERAGRS